MPLRIRNSETGMSRMFTQLYSKGINQILILMMITLQKIVWIRTFVCIVIFVPIFKNINVHLGKFIELFSIMFEFQELKSRKKSFFAFDLLNFPIYILMILKSILSSFHSKVFIQNVKIFQKDVPSNQLKNPSNISTNCETYCNVIDSYFLTRNYTL
jgi:hypothetical protein